MMDDEFVRMICDNREESLHKKSLIRGDSEVMMFPAVIAVQGEGAYHCCLAEHK